MAVALVVGALLATNVGWGSATASGESVTANDPARPGEVEVSADVLARGRAVEQARATGRSVAIEELTTEAQRVWALPNGRFKAEIASGPVRARRNGAWVDVDLTLRQRPDGTVAPRMHLDDLVLAGAHASGEHELATLGHGDERRVLSWSGRLPEPELDGSKATYADALPGIDLVIEARMTGYEQYTVVKEQAAVAQVPAVLAALQLDDRAGGADAEPDGRGGLEHRDSSGAVVGQTPTPLMWDAAVDAATGTPAAVREVDLAAEGEGYGLAPDRSDMAWLHDPARRFPVVIDPGNQKQDTRGDTFVRSSSSTTEYWNQAELEIGTQNSGDTKHIAYVNLSTAGMAGATIWAASIKLWGTEVAAGGSCANSQWQIFGAQTNAGPGTNWDNRPYLIDGHGTPLSSRNGNGSEGLYTKHPQGWSLAPTSGGCTGQWISSDARGVFQSAVDRQKSEFTAVLTPLWDHTNTFYKRFKAYDSGTYPHAIVYYSFAPELSGRSTIPETVCATGSARPSIATTTPTLSATYAQNEGIASQVTFEWSTLDGTVLGTHTVDGVASGARASVTVPAGHFTDGGTYRWRTRAVNGWSAASAWSDPCELRVEAWAAPVPGCPGDAAVGPDFNGDGDQDTVIADPLARAGGPEAGLVHVVDGRTGARSTLGQALTEVPDDPESGDRFGSALAVVDLNEDGCSDLVVGSPHEDLTAPDAGRVDVLYGTPTGLGQGPAAESLTQGTNGVPGAQVGYDWFGYALAADRTAEGVPFLVIGAPGDDVNGAVDAGTVTYLRGEHRIAFDQSIHRENTPETDDRGGFAVTATAHHVAVAYPGENTGPGTQFGGRVCVLDHTITDGRPGAVGCVSQDSAGVSDSTQAGDTFGKALSMAPYRGPGQPAGGSDSVLVVGVPGEDLDSAADAGLVQQFQVRGSGITELATVSQEAPGLATRDEPGDLFGEQVVVVNTDPGSEATETTLLLAAGAPGQDRGTAMDAGEVHVFPAGTGTIGQAVTVDRTPAGGLPGSPAPRELLGISLGRTQTELLVAAPYPTQQGVHALGWSDLADGRATSRRSWTPGSLSVVDAKAFGARVG